MPALRLRRIPPPPDAPNLLSAVTQGPDDVIRDRAAAVLASLALCGEEEAWTQAAGRVTLEAHGCVELIAPFVFFCNRYTCNVRGP